jgi:hypothetical protein
MWHAQERGETCTGFWWENPKEREHLEDQGVRWEDGIKMELSVIGLGGGGWWEKTWRTTGFVGGLL